MDELSGWVVFYAGFKFWTASTGVFISECLHHADGDKVKAEM